MIGFFWHNFLKRVLHWSKWYIICAGNSLDTLKRLFGLLWLNFAPNLHCWTLNHQHTYVECELKKIMQLYRPVLMMTIAPLLLNNVENFVEGLRCEAFQNTALGKLAEDPLFYRKIVFADEAHFWLNEFVNKQNCWFWSVDQPEELQKLPMQPVWSDLFFIIYNN